MKSKIRKKALRDRKALSREGILKKSAEISRRLFGLPDLVRAKNIMFYVSQGSEVNTRRMIEDALGGEFRVTVPVSRSRGRRLIPVLIFDAERDLSPGPRGVLEPSAERGRTLSPREIDLIVIPGVAFDRQGNRLGRGQAYYDSFLKEVRPDAVKVGLAFERQIVNRIPAAPHDVPVDVIVTERRVIKCRRDEG